MQSCVSNIVTIKTSCTKFSFIFIILMPVDGNHLNIFTYRVIIIPNLDALFKCCRNLLAAGRWQQQVGRRRQRKHRLSPTTCMKPPWMRNSLFCTTMLDLYWSTMTLSAWKAHLESDYLDPATYLASVNPGTPSCGTSRGCTMILRQ